MKIYIAASFLRRDRAAELRKLLRAGGHTVISRWIDGEGALEEYVQSDAEMADFAEKDYQDVVAANAVVCITGDLRDRRSRGGKHTELGIALARGMRMFLLGPREQIFHWHPAVRVADSVDTLMELLK